MKKPPSGRLFYLAGGEHRAREALPGFDGSAGAEPDRRRRVPGRSAHRDRVHGCTRQSPSLRQITEKGCLRAAFFSYLAGDAKCAARASPQTLLRNVRAPPLAGLSPPLSGQPLNRGACCSRSINGFPPCGDAWSAVPRRSHWRGMRSALRALRPKRCCATFGPLPLPASPRPCRGSPSTEGLVAPDPSMGFRRAGMPGRLYLAEATGGGCEVRCVRFAPNVAAQRSGPSPCRPLPAPVGAAPQQRGLLLQIHQWVPSCGDAWSTVPLPRSMAVQRQDLPHVVAPRASCPRPDHWPCRGDATTRWHSLPVAMLGPQGIDARYRAG